MTDPLLREELISRLRPEIQRQDNFYSNCTPPSTPAAVAAVMAEEVGKLAAAALHPTADGPSEMRQRLLTIAAAAVRMAALSEVMEAQARVVQMQAGTGEPEAHEPSKGAAVPPPAECPPMSIFHITADEDAELPLDSYAAHVVVAADEDAARALCPCRDECGCGQARGRVSGGPRGCVDFWTDPARSCCLRIGIAIAPYNRPGVVCSSFRAG